MIFYLSFTRTWVCKFNSLSGQEYCKNDVVSEYIYISIYIYIFLNGILTINGVCPVAIRFFSEQIFWTFGQLPLIVKIPFRNMYIYRYVYIF